MKMKSEILSKKIVLAMLAVIMLNVILPCFLSSSFAMSDEELNNLIYEALENQLGSNDNSVVTAFDQGGELRIYIPKETVNENNIDIEQTETSGGKIIADGETYSPVITLTTDNGQTYSATLNYAGTLWGNDLQLCFSQGTINNKDAYLFYDNEYGLGYYYIDDDNEVTGKLEIVGTPEEKEVIEDTEDSANLLEHAISIFITLCAQGILGIVRLLAGDGSLSIESIIFNKFPNTSLSIFKSSNVIKNPMLNGVFDALNYVFNYFRKIAMVAYMVIAAYMGLRILLSSTASKGAKHKELITYFVQGVIILFIFPYAIRYTIDINNAFVSYIYSNIGKPGVTIENGVSFEGIDNSNGLASFNEVSNSADADLRNGSDYMSEMYKKAIRYGWLVYAICFAVMVKQLIGFLIIYFKRVLTIVFLIAIFPLVSISYAIDKIGDGKSQAFNNWYKEFALNVFLQSFHAIVYVVGMALISEIGKGKGADDAWLLILLILEFISKGDDLLRNIFNVKGGGGDSVKGLAASVMQAKAAANMATSAKNAVSSKFSPDSHLSQARQNASNALGNVSNVRYQRAQTRATNAQIATIDTQIAATGYEQAPVKLTLNESADVLFSESASDEEKMQALDNILEDINNGASEEELQAMAEYVSGKYGEEAVKDLDKMLKYRAAANAIAGGKITNIQLNQNITILLDAYVTGGLAAAIASGVATPEQLKQLQLMSNVKFAKPQKRNIAANDKKNKKIKQGGKEAARERARRNGDKYAGTFTPGGNGKARASNVSVGGIAGSGNYSGVIGLGGSTGAGFVGATMGGVAGAATFTRVAGGKGRTISGFTRASGMKGRYMNGAAGASRMKGGSVNGLNGANGMRGRSIRSYTGNPGRVSGGVGGRASTSNAGIGGTANAAGASFVTRRFTGTNANNSTKIKSLQKELRKLEAQGKTNSPQYNEIAGKIRRMGGKVERYSIRKGMSSKNSSSSSRTSSRSDNATRASAVNQPDYAKSASVTTQTANAKAGKRKKLYSDQARMYEKLGRHEDAAELRAKLEGSSGGRTKNPFAKKAGGNGKVNNMRANTKVTIGGKPTAAFVWNGRPGKTSNDNSKKVVVIGSVENGTTSSMPTRTNFKPVAAVHINNTDTKIDVLKKVKVAQEKVADKKPESSKMAEALNEKKRIEQFANSQNQQQSTTRTSSAFTSKVKLNPDVVSAASKENVRAMMMEGATLIKGKHTSKAQNTQAKKDNKIEVVHSDEMIQTAKKSLSNEIAGSESAGAKKVVSLAASVVAINLVVEGRENLSASETLGHIENIRRIQHSFNKDIKRLEEKKTSGISEEEKKKIDRTIEKIKKEQKEIEQSVGKLEYDLDDFEANLRVQVLNDTSLVDSEDPNRAYIINSSIKYVQEKLDPDSLFLAELRYNRDDLRVGIEPVATFGNMPENSRIAENGVMTLSEMDQERMQLLDQKVVLEERLDRTRQSMNKEGYSIVSGVGKAAGNLALGALDVGASVAGVAFAATTAGVGSSGKKDDFILSSANSALTGYSLAEGAYSKLGGKAGQVTKNVGNQISGSRFATASKGTVSKAIENAIYNGRSSGSMTTGNDYVERKKAQAARRSSTGGVSFADLSSKKTDDTNS